MASEFNDNIFSASDKLLDAKWGPFLDTDAAYLAVPRIYREIGMFAIVASPSGAQLWWYKDNVDNLVLFTGNSSVQVYPTKTGPTGFPTTGSSDIIYIDKSEAKSYYWTTANGGEYVLTSGTSGVEVYTAKNNFPLPGSEGIIYVAADTDYSYLWDPAANSGTGNYVQITNNDGKSAYDIAVENGFSGTQQEWLDSLVGSQGVPGPQGIPGLTGEVGAQGPIGQTGPSGTVTIEGLVYRGVWTVLVPAVFEYGDVVSYDGGSYVRVVAGSIDDGDVTPDLNSDWVLLASQGATGPTGSQGPQGLTGPQGQTGPQGSIGPDGVKGDTGAAGPAGPQGAQGADGPAGVAGVKGDKGDTGSTGATGATGATGGQGPIGLTGPQGLTGSTGSTGSTGPQGPKGDAGEVGPAGLTWRGLWVANTSYSKDDAVGYADSSWFCLLTHSGISTPPNSDPTRWALLASQGAIGPQGPTGATGSTGTQGPVGPQGPAGATGSQGPIGVTGATGATGATGPQGPAGVEGPRGFQGNPGTNGTNGENGLPPDWFFQGPWEGLPRAYVIGDIVTYNGETWYNDGSATDTPSTANGWELLAAKGQDGSGGGVDYYTDEGTSVNTYVITTGNSLTSNTNGDTYLIKFKSANTGTSTLNVDGIGPVNLKNSKTQLDLLSGDIPDESIHLVVFANSFFEVTTIGGGGTADTGDIRFSGSEIYSISTTTNTITITPATAQPGQSLVIRPTVSAWGISSNGFIVPGSTMSIVISCTSNTSGLGVGYFGTLNYEVTGQGVNSTSLGIPTTGSVTFTQGDPTEDVTWIIPANSTITQFTFTITGVAGDFISTGPNATEDPELFYNFEANGLPTGLNIIVTTDSSNSSEHSHVHLVSGDPATVDIYLGDDDQYVKIEKDGGNVVVGTNLDTYKWTFGTNGRLAVPDLIKYPTQVDPAAYITFYNTFDNDTLITKGYFTSILGTAGGDLSGTYPNPTVAKLQGQPISEADPTNGQLLQWNGTEWAPGVTPTGGGGGGLIYYLNFNTAGESPLTNIPQTPTTTKKLGISGEITPTSYQSGNLSIADYNFLASFVTDVSVPSSTTIPAGIWDFNIFAESTSTNSANQIYFKVEILKYNGTNTPTFLATSNDIYIYDPAEINQYVASIIVPQTTILSTDRIVVYLYGRSHQNNKHITFHFGGNYPSHVHTTLPFVTGGGVTDGDKGDITVSGSGSTWTIDNNAITTAKIGDAQVTIAKISTTSGVPSASTFLAGNGTWSAGLNTGVVASGTARRLAMYTTVSTGTALGDAFTQNGSFTTNILLGTATLTASNTLTIPVTNANASFIMSVGTQTLSGSTTFSVAPTASVGSVILSGQGANTLASQLILNGGTTSAHMKSIDFGPATVGQALPTLTSNRSSGSRLILGNTFVASNSADYAIGLGSNVLWQSIPTATSTQSFDWYGGATQLMTLDGTGILRFTSTGTELPKIYASGSNQSTGNRLVFSKVGTTSIWENGINYSVGISTAAFLNTYLPINHTSLNFISSGGGSGGPTGLGHFNFFAPLGTNTINYGYGTGIMPPLFTIKRINSANTSSTNSITLHSPKAQSSSTKTVSTISGNGTIISVTLDNVTNLIVNQVVTISAVVPVEYNITGRISSIVGSVITINSTITSSYISGGIVTPIVSTDSGYANLFIAFAKDDDMFVSSNVGSPKETRVLWFTKGVNHGNGATVGMYALLTGELAWISGNELAYGKITERIAFGAHSTNIGIAENTTTTSTLNIGTGPITSGNTKTINFGTGGLSSSTTVITIGGNNGVTLGFFGVTPAVKQTGGVATASTTSYGTTEAGMLQRAYNALRAYGLLT